MAQLSKAQLKELKDLLLEEKEDLEAHFDLNNEENSDFDTSLKVSTGELSSYDNHPADLGTETFERGRDLAIDESLEDKLNEVNRALGLFESGEYGKCGICDQAIPFERLQALPWTSRCVEHASAPAATDQRPVEEQVMTPPPSGAGERRQENAGRFDDADAWQTLEEYGNASGTVKTGGKQL